MPENVNLLSPLAAPFTVLPPHMKSSSFKKKKNKEKEKKIEFIYTNGFMHFFFKERADLETL